MTITITSNSIHDSFLYREMGVESLCNWRVSRSEEEVVVMPVVLELRADLAGQTDGGLLSNV